MQKHISCAFSRALISSVPAFVFLVPVLVFLAPISTFAETHVSNTDHAGPVWDSAGSPYIIDGSVTIQSDENLTIEPGTTIIAGSDPASSYLYFEGSSTIDGTLDKPITFSNLPEVYLQNGNFLVQNVDFDNATLGMYSATATLDHISSTGADTAIFSWKSTVNADDISISSSTQGIDSIYARPVLVGFNGFISGVKSTLSSLIAEKAFAQIADDPNQSHIKIHDSSFTNTQYAIYNNTTNIVHAENNWWGSDNGPAGATSNMIYGSVAYDPWTGKATSTPATCCSSVLFIPGLEASRLSMDNRRFFGTSTSQLWEPISNLQVQGLYLDSSGNSIQQNIHPSGLLDNALGLQPIYQKFINTMNGLVASGNIADWQAYPYDWRLALTQTLSGTIGTSTLIKEVESMASTSKTGKVTIIAHSNGGLVAKLLYNQLEDKGEESLIDKMIFVAVPELGTPQAVASLLHGDSEAIANGLIMSAATARGLGINMPSAYSLLPDQDYFKAVPQAIISFASSTMAGLNFSKYFPAITTYSGLKSFIDDKSHGSLSDSTDIPVQGNAKLFPQAESVHKILDAWKPASSTQLVAIAGWGLPTNVGVNYFQKFVCALDGLFQETCTYDLQRQDINDSGDGTVILPSASYSSSTKQLFDISSYDADTKQGLAHADILQADPVETAIKQDLGVASSSTGIPYITSSIPADYKFPDDLVIDVHSPADINIYDKDGNHTGPIPNPIAGSDFDAYENKIPGSFYKETGDGVEVILPFDPNYKIDLDGTGIGGVTVDTRIENIGDGTEKDESSFIGMIVTPITHMEFAASTSTDEADAYQVLKIDEDGDGIFDATATPDVMPNISPTLYENSMANCVKSLHLPYKDEKNLLDRLNKAWQFAAKDKSGKAEKALKNMAEKRVHHLDPKKITDQNRVEMRGMIENMLDDMGM